MVNELENNVYLVNAPAGSGKTTWIRKQVEKHLIKYPNDNILCITYTNRAAEELGRELDTSQVYFGTIHKFINDFISSFFTHRKIIDLYWDIYKKQIEQRIENREQKENIAESNEKYIEKYGTLDCETVYKNLEKISYNETPFNSLYRGALSHDDLISFTKVAVEKFPIIKKKIAEKYQLIFIDEYQDTSADVLSIFYEAIYGGKGKLFLLGDKMQQIYKNYDGSFEKVFLTLNKTINLDTNYRTTPSIVAILNAIYNDPYFEQKPYKMNSDSNMTFAPRVVFTDDVENKVSNFTTEHPDALILYLSNKQRFVGIGAGNLYNVFSLMEKYKFGRKYTSVDVLTKAEVRDEDALLKLLFLLEDIFQNYENHYYGDVFRCIRNNPKIFNTSKYLVKQHSDKTAIKARLEELKCKYDSSTIKIGELIEICKNAEFISAEYCGGIMDDNDYDKALQVDMNEVKNLVKYLRNPMISTQHGVKGESHNTVVFVAENSNSVPIVHMSKFFEIWSIIDITLSDFDAFYYSYLDLIKSIETLCGMKCSAINKDNYKQKESDIKTLIMEYSEQNKNNSYYVQLLQVKMDTYLQKPNATNAKACLREGIVYGPLSAYRLFYVGCSRARRNLEIVIKNEDVESFKESLECKFAKCGFEIVQA